MSYIDPHTGEWKAGLPPGVSLAEAQARVARARYGKRLELAEGPSSIHAAPEERVIESLAEAQQRRRDRIAEQRAALMTEAETCKALGLDAGELYRDLELIAGCTCQGGELMFDAKAVAARAPQNDVSATAKAADLLLELRQNGLDLGGAA